MAHCFSLGGCQGAGCSRRSRAGICCLIKHCVDSALLLPLPRPLESPDFLPSWFLSITSTSSPLCSTPGNGADEPPAPAGAPVCISRGDPGTRLGGAGLKDSPTGELARKPPALVPQPQTASIALLLLLNEKAFLTSTGPSSRMKLGTLSGAGSATCPWAVFSVWGSQM